MVDRLLKNSKMLYDLGGIAGKRYQGVLSPLYSKKKVNEHIHDQFTLNSNEYVLRYQSTDYWEFLLRTAFDECNIKFRNSSILDLGSGAGNTVIPILEMFDESAVIATDLSIELLRTLKDFLDNSNEDFHNEYKLIQIDVHELDNVLNDNSFDIIIGGAILHHLYNPKSVLKQCYNILDKNGIAFFFEPFENGNLLLSLLYQLIINQNNYEKEKLSDNVISIFKQIIYDFDIRSKFNKDQSIFKLMDDKWLFSKNYFYGISDDIGFRSCSIKPITAELKNYFENETRTYLRLSIGFEYNKMPTWSKDLITLADTTFSDEAKKDLLTAGRIILKK